MAYYVHVGVGDKLLLLVASWLAALVVLPLSGLGSLLLFIAATLTLFIWHLKLIRSHWSRRNVPSLGDGHLIIGNTFDLFRQGIGHFYGQRLHALGDTFGYRYSDRNEICTMELRLMRQVLVKQFAHFQNRLPLAFRARFGRTPSLIDGNLLKNTLSGKRGDDWRRVRVAILPAFTTSKVKKLVPKLNACAEELSCAIDRLNAGCGAGDNGIALRGLFRCAAFDMIARVGFSLHLDAYQLLSSDTATSPNCEHDNDASLEREFLRNMDWAAEFPLSRYKSLLLVLCPFTMACVEQLFGVDLMHIEPNEFFRRLLLEQILKRRADIDAGHQPPGEYDMLQLLLEATRNRPIVGSVDELNAFGSPHSGGKSNGVLTRMELGALVFILFGAGYQINAYALLYAVYQLACCTDIQKRVRDEVMAVVGDSPAVTFEHSTQLVYTNAVIQETLRFYPNAAATNRECGVDLNLDGIPLSKGDIVTVPIYSVHHNAAYHPEPECFNPERFLGDAAKQRDPLTFIPFGYGPRNCVGQRFAELALRVALASLIRRYRLMRAQDSPALPIRVFAVEFTKPLDELSVRFERI